MPSKKTVKVKTEKPKSNPVKYVKEEDFENVYIIIKENTKIILKLGRNIEHFLLKYLTLIKKVKKNKRLF